MRRPLYLIVLTSICFFAFQNPGKNVSLVLQNATLELALDNISKQTDVHFVYASSHIENIVIDCEFRNTPLLSALDELLRGTDLRYRQTSETEIVLFKKRPTRLPQIAGEVVDKTSGETLPYANVVVAGTQSGASTDTQGRFVIKNVAAPCTLQIRYIGYETKRVAIDESSDVQNLRIALNQSALLAETVTINAENWDVFEVSDQPGQLTISPYNFSSLPIIGDKDVSRSLQLMPGISTSNFGASGLQIRGGLPSHNLVLLDGMPLYHMDHAFGFFNAFNVDAIKDVRVYKGGFPSKFGGRLSGVMELTARTGDFNRPRMSASSNPMSVQGTAETPIFKKGALLLSARRSFSQNILGTLYDRVFTTLRHRVAPVHFGEESPDDFQITPDKRRLYFYDVLSKLTVVPDKHNIFTINAYAGGDHISSEIMDDFEADDLLDEIPDLAASSERTRWANLGVSGRWFRQWRPDFSSQFQIAFTDYFTSYAAEEDDIRPDEDSDDGDDDGSGESEDDDSEEESDVEVSSRNDLRDLTLRLDQHLVWRQNLSFDFGVTHTRPETRLSLNEAVNDSLFPDIEDFEPEEIEESAFTNLSTLYLESRANILSRLRLTAGARANVYHAASTDVFWEPRAAADLAITPGFSLKASWGRNYQFLLQYGDAYQDLQGSLSWILADGVEIQPAFSEHLSAGLKLESQRFLFDAEFYRRDLGGLFATAFDPRFFLDENDADPFAQTSGGVRGVDLLLQKKSGKLNGWASYSYSENWLDYLAGSGFGDYPANQSAPHNLKLVGNFNTKKWTFSATWQYVSGKPFSTPVVREESDADLSVPIYVLLLPEVRNDQRLPATHRLDLNISRQFYLPNFNGRISFSLFNAYDRRNVWYRYFTVKEKQPVQQDVYTLGITPTLILELKF